MPRLEVGGVSVGEFAELVAGGGRERGQPVGDLDVAVAARGVNGDGDGAGLLAGNHAGIGDALARLAAGNQPDGVLTVGAGFEDGAWLGVVGDRAWESGVPSVHPVLLTARGEQAERLAGREGDLDVAGKPLRAGHGCSFSLCASAAVRVRP